MPSAGVSFSSDPKAVSRFDSRRATPSSRTSAEWERVAPALREKCFFSARVNDAEVLGKMRELLGEAIDSSKRDSSKALVSQDKFISEMKDFLRSRGYTMGGSKLTDITSRRRLGLIYDMNIQEAREYARYVRGQDADALDMYPAQEFLRVESRRVPRTDWPARWRAAGGKIRGGRMVALKSDSVWTNLSRFGRPYPPFDYGSGMGVEDVDREEAIELGLLPADEPSDEIPDFDIRLEAEVSLDRIPEDMLDSIIKETPNAGVSDAKKRLQDGFVVETSYGGSVKFDSNVLRHWEEMVKHSDDVYGRLQRLNVAQDCIREALEVWELPNGQRMYLNIFKNTKGKIKGIAVAVSDDTVVRTWFINKVQELDKCRKGRLILKH